MKKVLGLFALIASICWCFLMIPRFAYGVFDQLSSLLLSKSEITITHYFIAFISVSISVAIIFMVTKFGLSLLKSSWQMISGKKVARLSIRERVNVLKKPKPLKQDG